jgi:hypothetical protein
MMRRKLLEMYRDWWFGKVEVGAKYLVEWYCTRLARGNCAWRYTGGVGGGGAETERKRVLERA